MNSVYILMGVSGCGKTTIGESLAALTGGSFIDADHLHSPGNVAKMRAGIPLTDQDRAAWLDTVGQAITTARSADTPTFIACSALKKSYRNVLRQAPGFPRFIYLYGPQSLLQQRLKERQGHYMPASLLQSQLDALEPPTDDESFLTIDVSPPPQAIAQDILSKLSLT
jgi:gluconokinase